MLICQKGKRKEKSEERKTKTNRRGQKSILLLRWWMDGLAGICWEQSLYKKRDHAMFVRQLGTLSRMMLCQVVMAEHCSALQMVGINFRHTSRLQICYSVPVYRLWSGMGGWERRDSRAVQFCEMWSWCEEHRATGKDEIRRGTRNRGLGELSKWASSTFPPESGRSSLQSLFFLIG